MKLDTNVPNLTRKSIILYALSGAIVACVVALLASVTVYPGLRDSFYWPNIPVFFGFNFAIPGAVAGSLIKSLSKNLAARVSGFLGIILGVLWQLQLGFMLIVEEYNEELGTLVLRKSTAGNTIMRLLEDFGSCLHQHSGVLGDIFVIFLPVLLALLGIAIANFISGIRFGKEKPEENRKFHCSHCGREISYNKYRYGVELCDSCAEASCMG